MLDETSTRERLIIYISPTHQALKYEIHDT
jgi:hypothetical protein